MDAHGGRDGAGRTRRPGGGSGRGAGTSGSDRRDRARRVGAAVLADRRHEGPRLTRRRLLIAGGTAVGSRCGGDLGRGGVRPPWTATTGDKVYSSPLVDDGVVYIGSNDRYLYALDAATGAQRWRYPTQGSVTSSPADRGRHAVRRRAGRVLHAVDARTGERRWATDTGGPVHSSPAVAGDLVVVGSRSNKLLACDVRSGAVLWKFVRGDWFNSSPTIVDGVVYVGCRDHNVYAVDAATGDAAVAVHDLEHDRLLAAGRRARRSTSAATTTRSAR